MRAVLGRASDARAGTPKQIPIDADTAAEVLPRCEDGRLALAHVNEASPRLATVKDLDYLRWRYGHFQEYRAVTSEAGDLAIFRIRRHGRVWVSYVLTLGDIELL